MSDLSRAEMRELWTCLGDMIGYFGTPYKDDCEKAYQRGLVILADKPDLMTPELIAKRLQEKNPFPNLEE